MCKKWTCLTLIILVLVLAADTPAELMVQWNLDEGSGTIVSDTSGNGRDGIFNGEPQWVAGHNSAGALHFDGVDDFVVHDLGQTETFPTFSVAFWVKADTLGQPVYASPFTGHYPNSAGFQVDVDGGNPGNYRINPNSGNQFAFGPVTLDWVHLALTGEGTSMNLYYNGELAGSNTLVDTDVVFNQFAIGVNRNRNWWFACTIDDLRVYDHILSEAEILGTMESKPFPFALGPNPADGVLHEATWASLSWSPGALAVSHDVYAGESFEDVDAGAEGTFQGNQSTTNLVVGFPGFPFPDGLVPGTTYYWRIDEVNEADPNSPWRGDVWSFWIPLTNAYAPSPADGARYIDREPTLSWQPGFGAKLHNVVFGDNPDEVENALTGSSIIETTFTPGQLEAGKTYYWRVDELDPPTTIKGDVWTFTTLPDIPIADPDLVGWWKLDEGAGTTVVDWSGHGNHGTFVGEPSWADGIDGGAVVFDGKNDYINCGNNAVLDITDQITLSVWVKTNDSGNGQHNMWLGKGDHAYAIKHQTGNNIEFFIYDGDWYTAQYAVDDSFNGLWHHVAGTYDGTALRVYLDGELVVTVPVSYTHLTLPTN